MESSNETIAAVPRHKLVALCGYARCGKDTAGRALINHGYERVSFGDIIKEQTNALVKAHLGFSTFTQDDEQKKQIRPLLESWGDVNYEKILSEFFANLPEFAVNTRLVRVREAKMWKERGGVLVQIVRQPRNPATDWERDALYELAYKVGFNVIIHNNSTEADLHARVLEFVGINNNS